MADPKDLLAAERTLLAWIRTGIALMAFGFVLARFGLFLRELALIGGHSAAPRFDGVTVGPAVVASGVLVNVWATVRHRGLVRRLRSGISEVPTTGPLVVGIASGVLGLILIALLMSR
jgi:putative membrane protein